MKITINEINIVQENYRKLAKYYGIIEDKYEFHARVSAGIIEDVEMLFVDAEDKIRDELKSEIEKFLEIQCFCLPEMGEMEF